MVNVRKDLRDLEISLLDKIRSDISNGHTETQASESPLLGL
jgi:hypothetical protein